MRYPGRTLERLPGYLFALDVGWRYFFFALTATAMMKGSPLGSP